MRNQGSGLFPATVTAMKFIHTETTSPRNALLLIHGLDGSGEGHWQHWLAHKAAERGLNVHFPELPSKESPNLLYWLSLLHLEAVAAGAQTTLVTHSLGAYLWLHYASLKGAQRLDRVLLVAPPGETEVRESGRVRGLLNIPLDAARIRSAAREVLVIGTANDPYNQKGAEQSYAKPLGLPYLGLPASAGHINIESGFGPWPFALEWTQKRKKSLRALPSLFARKSRLRSGQTHTQSESLRQAV